MHTTLGIPFVTIKYVSSHTRTPRAGDGEFDLTVVTQHMSQERLSVLVMVSIKNGYLDIWLV